MNLMPIVAASHLPRELTSPWMSILPLLPALSLSVLLVSSTIFTESLSAAKYSEYAAYRSRVAMLWPISTFFKGIYLSLTGQKEDIDRVVWGRVKGKRIE